VEKASADIARVPSGVTRRPPREAVAVDHVKLSVFSALADMLAPIGFTIDGDGAG